MASSKSSKRPAKRKPTSKRRVIEAEELNILDAQGNVRIVMDTWSTDGSPSICLYNSSGPPAVQIRAAIDSSYLSLMYPDGQMAATMRCFSDNRVAFCVFRRDGTEAFRAGIDINGDVDVQPAPQD